MYHFISPLYYKDTLIYYILKLELRESDVSPCEQYSLGEMARSKMKYEN
jgi:hypothetical protein